MAEKKGILKFLEKSPSFLAINVAVRFILNLIFISWALFIIIAFVPILWIKIIMAVIFTLLYGLLTYGLFKSLRIRQKGEGQ